jgi:hypothetical protein
VTEREIVSQPRPASLPFVISGLAEPWSVRVLQRHPPPVRDLAQIVLPLLLELRGYPRIAVSWVRIACIQ